MDQPSVFKDGVVQVHPLTNDPTTAYRDLNVSSKVVKESSLPLDTPIYEDKVRFVCVSDTHNETSCMPPVPDGDVLLHAGDFTVTGRIKQLLHFKEWLESQRHTHKVFIAGNHDIPYDIGHMSRKGSPYLSRRWGVTPSEVADYLKSNGLHSVRDIVLSGTQNITYLEDEGIELYGLKIWGSPWQPEFHDWGFNLPRGHECLEKWNKIPAKTDVVVTHGPPLGVGDLTCTGVRTGCVELYHSICHRIKPKYHVFGHIHEDPGLFRSLEDDSIHFINASTCNVECAATQPPIIFDLPLPEGMTK